ncbi:MAG: hypothetical protein IJE24_00900, partial [Oscillospiraceae bacterium]|nr:hypothetical protein [Oscillospiraceae bacterium]
IHLPHQREAKAWRFDIGASTVRPLVKSFSATVIPSEAEGSTAVNWCKDFSSPLRSTGNDSIFTMKRRAEENQRA